MTKFATLPIKSNSDTSTQTTSQHSKTTLKSHNNIIEYELRQDQILKSTKTLPCPGPNPG